jgi:hypothetical protein
MDEPRLDLYPLDYDDANHTGRYSFLKRNEILIYFSISIRYPHIIIYFFQLQGMKSFSSLVQIDRFNSRRARANTSANFFRVQMRFH